MPAPKCCHGKRRDRCRTCHPIGAAKLLIEFAQRRSKQKPDLDPEWIAGKFEAGCPVLGKPFVDDTHRGYHSLSPSLDQFDPGAGYTRDNVWVISQKANMIKSDATPEELLQVYGWSAIVSRFKRTLSATKFWLARATMISRHEQLTEEILKEFEGS